MVMTIIIIDQLMDQVEEGVGKRRDWVMYMYEYVTVNPTIMYFNALIKT